MNLQDKAKEIRRYVLETALVQGKGHIPPALSWVEIAVALFYGGMSPIEDDFILSKVHGHLTLDAILEKSGIEAVNLMWPGWPYKCSGSLGQGLGIAAGRALANKIDGKPGRVFCVLGDAECHEGSVWEAVMFAAHHNLNLTAIIDDNAQCCADRTADVLNMQPLAKKFRAFGWSTSTLHDGHDFEDLISALRSGSYPHCIIAKTIKGKGIPFMEGNPKWHHQIPTGAQIEEARRALA